MADVVLTFNGENGELIISTEKERWNDLFIHFDKNKYYGWTITLNSEDQKELIKKLVANL